MGRIGAFIVYLLKDLLPVAVALLVCGFVVWVVLDLVRQGHFGLAVAACGGFGFVAVFAVHRWRSWDAAQGGDGAASTSAEPVAGRASRPLERR